MSNNKDYKGKVSKEIHEARKQGQYVRSKTWSPKGDKKDKKLSRKRFNSRKSRLKGENHE